MLDDTTAHVCPAGDTARCAPRDGGDADASHAAGRARGDLRGRGAESQGRAAQLRETAAARVDPVCPVQPTIAL